MQIDKNIPPPGPLGRPKGSGRFDKTLKAMEINDSFFQPFDFQPATKEDSAILRSCLGQTARRLRIAITSRCVNENGLDGLRVWRISKPTFAKWIASSHSGKP